MRYILAPIYAFFPAVFIFAYHDMFWLGVAIGSILNVASWFINWKIEFGYWRFWK